MAVKKRRRVKVLRNVQSVLRKVGVKRMGEQLIYKTEFINHTASEWVVYNGSQMLVAVPPHQKSAIESFLPTVQWSRWRRVTKRSADEFIVEENPSWLNPYEADFFLELYNQDGAPIQGIRVADGNPLASAQGFVHVLKGIPLTVPMRALNDPYIYYRRIAWVKERYRIPIGKTDYFTFGERVVAKREPRSDDEIAEIVRRRAEEVRKAAEEKAENEALKLVAEAAKATGADAEAIESAVKKS